MKKVKLFFFHFFHENSFRFLMLKLYPKFVKRSASLVFDLFLYRFRGSMSSYLLRTLAHIYAPSEGFSTIVSECGKYTPNGGFFHYQNKNPTKIYTKPGVFPPQQKQSVYTKLTTTAKILHPTGGFSTMRLRSLYLCPEGGFYP